MTAERIRKWMEGENPEACFTTFAIYNEESVDLLTEELGADELPTEDKREIIERFQEEYNEQALDMLWDSLKEIIKNKLKEKADAG